MHVSFFAVILFTIKLKYKFTAKFPLNMFPKWLKIVSGKQSHIINLCFVPFTKS